MSMRMCTILQFIQVAGVYLLMTVLLPAFVLRTRIRERRLTERFLICFLTGNFYIMSLVFLLQLLHISYRVTLLLGTLLPALIVWVYVREVHPLPFFREKWRLFRQIVEGKMGVKTAGIHALVFLGKKACGWGGCLWRSTKKRWLECLFLVVVFLLLVFFYGSFLLRSYGYTTSDTPVHLYWINAMSKNQIFVDGIYPFGYHCIIYYMHTVFDIDGYVLMRVFSFVQTVMIHLVLLGFIRLCCRSKYVAYGAVGVYIIGDLLHSGTYFRFFSALPQEYGMAFILPAIYFAFRFFMERRQEVKKDLPRKESRICLACFAMSFSMTLAVHFYDTMIAGLFCVGIAVGYLFFFLRKQYFWSVLLTCLVSVLLALLPMGIAFATGTPLQGSLGWGMSVIEGKEETLESPNVIYYDANGKRVNEEDADGSTNPALVSQNDGSVTKITLGKIYEKAVRIGRTVRSVFCGTVLNGLPSGYGMVAFVAVFLLFVFGIVFMILKRPCYGSMLLSTGVFMVLILILHAAKGLGIPELMDNERSRIYVAYMLPVVFAFVADAILRLIFWKKNWKIARNVCSALLVVTVAVLVWRGQSVKEQMELPALVTDEAIICLSNIIREEEDFTWTICSANDETQMAYDHGYHYESISFLQDMEQRGDKTEEKPVIQFPTEKVYFFVEKVPIDYTEEYTGSGQSVSGEGAIRELPYVNGMDAYMGENRWIVMSRMYYWAKEFQRLYPNEMKTYFETDRFVCYEIEQNPYRLYNFAIDYGYNIRKIEG